MGGKRIINSIVCNINFDNMLKSGIYRIHSKVKPIREYIGSAVRFSERLRNHKSTLNRNIHCSKKLQNHCNKYGMNDLIFEIIEYVENIDTLLEKEQLWISVRNPYFNIILQGITGGTRGIKLSEESKRKISIANKGNKYGLGHVVSEEHKEKLRNLYKGKKISEEERSRLRKINIGVVQPKEQIIKRMISMLGKDRINKVKEIQKFFDTKIKKEEKYGDDIKYLSKTYDLSRSVIRNIKSGKMYNNFKNYEL